MTLKAKAFVLRCVYRLNQSSWKIHGIASINFDCFIMDESNQVKIFREIMRCQGYFYKIALGLRLREKDPVPKTCCTYPTMMKLDTVGPYLKKTQKIYKSSDAPLEFC